MVIKTACIYPPVPSRQFDYAAWIDGREEGPTGYGPTPEAAIADLREWLELEEDTAA